MSNLIFNIITPPLEGINGVLNLDSLGANAEISAYNPVSGILYTVGGGSGAIVVSDLTDPSNPRAVAVATPSDNSNTLQSVAVFGQLLAVAVQNPVKTEPGFVQFYDLTNPVLPVFLSSVTVGALPDMVKFNNDGTKLLVTNEGEPDNEYAIDPVGSISVIDTSAYLSSTPQAPTQANVQTIDFSPWEGRKEELINRGIRIAGRPGVTTTLAQDIEPEAIAITRDGNTAYISLQENNAIAILDLSTDTPQITNIFSAGIQDWERGRPSAENFNYSLSYAMGDNNLPEGVLAGGLSGLWFDGVETINEQPLDVYYSITDRGPNGDLVDGKRQFLDPDFQPTIYKLGMNRGTGEIIELDKVGLNRQDGTPLTGLPQLAVKDDIPIDSNNQDLPYDPFGIDSETVGVFSVTIEGVERKVFAVGDEYRGQIALFDFTTGNLIQRYIPAGQKALLQQQHGQVIGAETIDSLPAIYGNRWPNRGIEAMSFNPNNGLLYAFMQSPLDNINQEGRPSRSRSELIRILAIDPATGIPQREHFYLLSGRPTQDKLGDAVFDPVKGVFYVIERDSSRNLNGLKHIYEVDLRGATNTLDITLTDGWTNLIGVAQPELLDNRRTLVDGVYSISTADTLAGAGIRLAHKVELFNLPSIGGTLAYDKPEGLGLRDDGALVINYDNDFGTEGASGNSFTVVTFNSMGLDSSDRDGLNDTNIYRPLTGLKVYGLTMPDGLATYTDSLGRTFILAAGEGDSREYPPDEGNVFYDLTRANSSTSINDVPFRNHPGVELLNLSYDPDPGVRTRLNLLNNYGDITGDGLIDQAYTIGSRSLRIFDDKGNVVFDSGNALEELANSLGLMASNRDDDKGTEPEMVEVVTVNGRTHALVALERTTTSVAAVFDITDPYNVLAVDPIIFPDANRIEGIAFLTTPTGKLQGVIASSEGNDVVSVIPQTFTLQLFHFADREAGASAFMDIPRFSAVLNALKAEDLDNDGIPGFPNTLVLSSGGAYIPGLFFNASQTVYGGVGRGDILIQNALGVQAVALGNHEFDAGTGVLRDLIAGDNAGFPGTAFPYLSSNLDFSTDTNLADLVVADAQAPLPKSIAASVVFDVNGEKIGVVGATTPTLRILSANSGGVTVTPQPFDVNPTPSQLDALAAEIQSDVDVLLATNPDVNKVILLSHMRELGIELELATRLRSVDIIVTGGSNTRLVDENDRLRVGDTEQGNYPLFTTDADRNPVAVVSNNGNYKYLGRLVVDFDHHGVIIPDSYNPNVGGSYATDAQGVADLGGLVNPEIQAIVDSLQDVVVQQESNFFGVSSVYLNGDRNSVRRQETNLGNLTADANLAIARDFDPDVVISFKNGGGIRNSIGRVVVPTGAGMFVTLPNEAVIDGNGNIVKPEGGISQNDIANALSFNNGLTLVTLTAAQLLAIAEHGVASITSNDTTSPGSFPQISGFSFSFDLTREPGNRVRSLAIEDETGKDLDVVVRAGEIVGDPNRTFRMVTLNFLAGGGDGYPFPQGESANQLVLAGDAGVPPTGNATFAPDGTEQDALAEYLFRNFLTTPFSQADTHRDLDTRLQNLAFRADTVIDSVSEILSVINGSPGADDLILTSTQSGITVFTGDGDDQVDGSQAVSNAIYSGKGNDTILVGSDSNVSSGDGDDTLMIGTQGLASTSVLDGGRGQDTLIVVEADGPNILLGGADNDTLQVAEGRGQMLFGGDRRDMLRSSPDGHNRLYGGSGDDQLYSTVGDRLFGGDGNDSLYAGQGGNNSLWGGAGADNFWLVVGGSLADAPNVVKDFELGIDRIGMGGITANQVSLLSQNGNTIIRVSGTDVALIEGVNSAQFNLNDSSQFVFA